MNVFTPFLVGLLCSLFGTLLPGLLNASVVKIHKKEGKIKAHQFISGALFVIALQTYLAVFFARLINDNAEINFVLREIGTFVFIGLSIFFFVKKKKPAEELEINVPRKINRILFGSFLAVLNIFPIFLYVFVTVYAASKNWYEINPINNFLLTIGVLLGTYTAFRLYIQIFKNKSIDTNFFLKNINTIIGVLTLTIALINAYKLIDEI